MLKSFTRSPALLITLPLLTLMATSHQAQAEIYKWRDNRGVIQYSDRPPVAAFTKITRNEMINALQTKDLCTVGPIQKVASSTRNASAFLGQINRAKWVSPIGFGKSPTTNTASSNKTSNSVTNQYSALASKSVFSSGTKTVAVLGSRVGPVFSAPKTTTTSPVAVGPTPTKSTSPTSSTPVVTAPNLPTAPSLPLPLAPSLPAAPTVTAPAPTQVATASPPPATTVVTNPGANLVQVGLMPAVDISKNMIPAVGFNTMKIQPTTEVTPSGDGAFRVGCGISHMSNDDPVVYPNQQGAAHHHTFFGNTSVNYKSNLETLSTTGNSTCGGGIMNRSAYWIPSMINTETNEPIIPTGNILVYYKKGFVDAAIIKAPPKGLRMISGNGKATTASESSASGFKCHPGPKSKRTSWPQTPNITPPSGCEAGDDLTFFVAFPQCWDGKNLDSPNHKDHMSNPQWSDAELKWSCPVTHPVAIPEIGFNVHYIIKETDKIDKWRLASDNYSKSLPGGFSAHGDWVNGWDEATMNGIVKNCINAKKDAHAHLLCDGRSFY